MFKVRSHCALMRVDDLKCIRSSRVR